jgi:hypothetical protein
MRNKTFIITLATILLASFCMASAANAFVGTATLSVILVVTMAAAIFADETVKHHRAENEKKPAEPSAESRSPGEEHHVTVKTFNPVEK